MALRIDRKKLTELMKDFHTLSGIRLVIFDRELEKVCSVPERECDFCTLMKSDPVSKKLCRACDEKGCRQSREQGGLYIYTCHAGLTEAVFPLRYGGVTFGYIMFGQLIDSGGKTTKEQISSYASAFFEKTAPAVEKLTVKDPEQILAAAKLMETCACYLWVSEMISGDDGDLAFRIADYIDKNLAQSLSVDSLCDFFRISRRKLYSLSEELFGMPPAAYIRRRRIEKATQLLSSGHTVCAASEAVGIADYNYFSKLYRRQTGNLPGNVRRGKNTDRDT